ncbi:MAG: acyloxyacyl hydrolase [Planctomycetota bacterium]
MVALIWLWTLFPLLTDAEGASAPAPPERLFPRGTRAFSLMPSYGGEKGGSNEAIGTLAFQYGEYLLDDLALHVDLVGYELYDRRDSYAIGLDLGARYHFITLERTSLFAGLAGGLFEGTGRFPDEGTHFNWTYQTDLGLTFELSRGFHLIGGARFKHVSNGFIKGRARNPATNTYGGFFGFMITF